MAPTEPVDALLGMPTTVPRHYARITAVLTRFDTSHQLRQNSFSFKKMHLCRAASCNAADAREFLFAFFYINQSIPTADAEGACADLEVPRGGASGEAVWRWLLARDPS